MKDGLERTQVVVRWSHLKWTSGEGNKGWDTMVRIIKREKSCSGSDRALNLDSQCIMISDQHRITNSG